MANDRSQFIDMLYAGAIFELDPIDADGSPAYVGRPVPEAMIAKFYPPAPAFDAIAFARASAAEAIDQRDAFGGVANALASYRENIIDTMADEGVADTATVQQALDTFDAAALAVSQRTFNF